VQCLKCNHQEVEGAKFCTNCGEPLKVEEMRPEVNFCPGCGSKREAEGIFCINCGYNFLEGRAIKEVSTSKEISIHSANPELTFEKRTEIIYASFGQRLGASLIDLLINLVLSVTFVLLFFSDSANYQLWGFIIGIAYKAGMESSSLQGTLGKMAVGIKVVDLQGERISFPRALGRYFASFLSSLILGVGYLLPLFTEKKQTLHDMIAGTLVKIK
jgi:uncharacterized RDD family membrane protein YckC